MPHEIDKFWDSNPSPGEVLNRIIKKWETHDKHFDDVMQSASWYAHCERCKAVELAKLPDSLASPKEEMEPKGESK